MVCGEVSVAVACASRSKRRSMLCAAASLRAEDSGRTSLIAGVAGQQPVPAAPDFAHAAAAQPLDQR